ncbi:hypothetical protein DPMN_115514 [Dreissena polymorpha]|uniref:Uncharacterized protein n=1 Tax=Dreissena polymorpha TaxID=45954 RepID=A0A9D4QSJ2_DREPO|nr:hypothetical protein DPMN_115514 [Dreissena polymorpha]
MASVTDRIYIPRVTIATVTQGMDVHTQRHDCYSDPEDVHTWRHDRHSDPQTCTSSCRTACPAGTAGTARDADTYNACKYSLHLL